MLAFIRAAAAAFVVSLALLDLACARILYVTPAGKGARSGTSWENAAKLDRLPALISSAGPGGSIWLRADMGPYEVTKPIIIRNGGRDGKPITVTGVDGQGNPMRAEVVGSRAFPYDPAGEQGKEVFRLQSKANNLTFRNLSFRNIGNGAFRIASDLQNLLIEDMVASNVTRFIENTVSGRGSSASIKGLIVRNVSVAGFSKGFARIRYDSSDILLEDIHADSERQDGGDFAIGVHLDGTTHDVVLRRVTMLNAHDTLHEYWNGDGFATETGTYAILFEDTVASGNTDAGYDLKSRDTIMVRPRASDNKRNFRFHQGESDITDFESLNPHKRGGSGGAAHFWAKTTAIVNLHGGRSEGNSPVFADDGTGPTFNATRAELNGSTLHTGTGTVNLMDCTGTALD